MVHVCSMCTMNIYFLGPDFSSSVVMHCILLALYLHPDVLGPPKVVIAGLLQAEGRALLPPPPLICGRKVNPISTRGPQYYEPPLIFRPCDGPE